MIYKFTNLELSPELRVPLWNLTMETWNPITLASKPLQKNWPNLFEKFPRYQLILVDENEEIIGYANSIPFHFNKNVNQLPDTGWDWMLEKGITDFDKNLAPNLLGGLIIGVAQNQRGQQRSKLILSKMKELFNLEKFQNLVIPIRPILKDKHPQIDMLEYLNWKKEEKVFDPWIRRHLDSGAEIISVCKKSMTIEAPISQWNNWTNQSIQSTGFQSITNTLSPVYFDIKKDTGVYEEPNVWVKYEREF